MPGIFFFDQSGMIDCVEIQQAPVVDKVPLGLEEIVKKERRVPRQLPSAVEAWCLLKPSGC